MNQEIGTIRVFVCLCILCRLFIRERDWKKSWEIPVKKLPIEDEAFATSLRQI